MSKLSPSRDNLWSLPFILAMITSLLVDMVFISLMTTIGLYTIEQFHADETLAGLAAGCFVLGAVASRLLFSQLIDTCGRRRTFLIALVAYATAMAAYFIAGDVSTLIAIRFVHGAAFGVAHTAIATSAMALIPDSRRGEGTGFYGLSAALTAGLGPFIAITLTSHFPMESVFLFTSVCSLGALLAALFIRPRESALLDQRPVWRFRFSDMLEPSALGIASVILVCGSAYSGVMVFLNAHALGLGVPEVAGVFFIVYSVVIVFSRMFVGRLQDRFGDNAVMYPLFGTFSFGLLLLGLATNGGTLLVAAMFLGIGFGGLTTSAQSITVTIGARQRLAITVSTYFTLLDIGLGIGPVLLGIFAAATGFSLMYSTGAGIVVVGAVLYYFVHGKSQANR